MAEHRWGKELDQVILTVTWDLLAQVGYDKLTINAVAQASKTNKNAIYRRWQNKAELVLATIQSQAPALDSSVPDTGNLGGDLTALFTKFTPLLATVPAETWQRLIPDALLTAADNQAVGSLVAAINGDNLITTATAQIIEQAKKRREPVRSALKSEQLALPALLLINQLMLAGALSSEKIATLVNDILLPIYLVS
ncbi:helix-turn-helix domain-containing protein [Lactiplantibacillus herbarum]|uniref:helix-turn-helix domain-containing protein n=1 Tax=Lactiplantibacillus herbarum TaxID=1670446 RepID=UPI00064EB5AE|nr:TetR/AcrR family transcriptional regulator [Lactiplantibacillus herbarum]